LRFKISFSLSDSDKAVEHCFECFSPLMTHNDVFYVKKRTDKAKYAKDYPLCKDCLEHHQDIYRQSEK